MHSGSQNSSSILFADLLAKWRDGRLPLTELREQLHARGPVGAQLRIVLDRAIIDKTLDSISDEVLQTPLPFLPGDKVSSTDKASAANPDASNEHLYARTTVDITVDIKAQRSGIDDAQSADQQTSFQHTALLKSAENVFEKTSLLMREQPIVDKTLVLPNVLPKTPESSELSALSEPSEPPAPQEPPKLYVTQGAADARLTLIRPTSPTVLMQQAESQPLPDDGPATVLINAPASDHAAPQADVDFDLFAIAQDNALNDAHNNVQATLLRPSHTPTVVIGREPAQNMGEGGGTGTIVMTQREQNPELVDFPLQQLDDPNDSVHQSSNPPSNPYPSTTATATVTGMVLKQRFVLTQKIGAGAMGMVFAAVDKRKTEAHDPNPMVAIKVLDAEFARHDKAFITMQREARKAQDLAHPNVVTVFDFDREDDRLFMTMELLHGRSLEGVIRDVRKNGIDPQQALSIVAGVAEGLAYAHRKGIVHSDLKPGNIFLTDDNIPKILDFGIARALPSRAANSKTKDSFDAGSLGAYTEAYATEEMVRGGDPDTSDDVYALGLITYELLTGAHPYKRNGAQKARSQKMKPAPIKGLKRREWRLIEASLAFDRADRPRDAGEFLKRMSGIKPLQKRLAIATVVLAVATASLGYLSYKEAGPSVPFVQLPLTTQQEFLDDMRQGDENWKFYVKDNNLLALQDAVAEYAKAYELHPRNRDATKALRTAADTSLASMKKDKEQQRKLAQVLAERSDYLAKYTPVRELLQ